MTKYQQLAKFGYRFGRSGPHASRTMMLDELSTLLATAPVGAARAEYRREVVELNVLGKPTMKARELTFRHLTDLYGLDPALPVFRIFRRLWDQDEHARPMLALMISSRSFGTYVHDRPQLEEAVASYIAIAAEKLRSQKSLAGMVQVYIRTNPHQKDHPQYQPGVTVPLPSASDDTLRLTRAALWGLRRIYRPGYAYQTAGVALLGITQAGHRQLTLFSGAKDNTRLMAVMDRINGIWGRGTLYSAAEGISKDWKMKRERKSPSYTTRWDQLPVVT